MEKNIILEDLWKLAMTNNYLSYECRDEIVFRAERAIKNSSIAGLCDAMILFKPDDACDPERSLERHSAEDVEGYMRRLGIMDYVFTKIHSK